MGLPLGAGQTRWGYLVLKPDESMLGLMWRPGVSQEAPQLGWSLPPLGWQPDLSQVGLRHGRLCSMQLGSSLCLVGSLLA